MKFAYEPPTYFSKLAPKQAARTQLGWGVGEDGSIDLEHVMSANPFAGKTHNWGIAEIDQDGDIIIQSKGPGNAESEHTIPPELIQKIVEFYEKEGLNVRNISEKTADFTDEHLSPSLGPDTPEGMCPSCHSTEVYGVPGTPFVDCESCGWHGDEMDVLPAHENPDPDETPPASEDYNYNQDFITDASVKEAGASFQGATIYGTQPSHGLVIRPDMQSEQEALALIEHKRTTPHDEQKRYVDERNKGQGTSFPAYDNPYTNRGGSLIAEKIDDHFIEGQPYPKISADPVGVPSTGPHDPRNFDSTLAIIVVAKNLITDHNWSFMSDKIGQYCKGVVTELGGATSHAAYVAGSLNLPLITGIPVDEIKPGDILSMNPATGTVDVNGGDTDVQQGDTEVKNEAVRFVWSNGNHMETPWGEPKADTHVEMIIKMATNGLIELDPQSQEPVNATRGVIYDNGDGEYYDEISDEDAMTQWVYTAFPQCKTMVYKPTGANYQIAASTKEALLPFLPKGDPGSNFYPAYRELIKNNPTGPAPGMIGPGKDYHDQAVLQAQVITRAKAIMESWLQQRTVDDEQKEKMWQKALSMAAEQQPEQIDPSHDLPKLPQWQERQLLVAEITESAPKCPECGSHTYRPMTLPPKSDGKGPAELKCLNCGTDYKHEVYRNPKKSDIGVVAEIMAEAQLEKLAPGKEHMKGVSPKRNRMYEHVLESVKKEHPDWSEERQKEYAARTVNKYREEHGETKSSIEDYFLDSQEMIFESAKPTFDQAVYEEKNPRTSPETQECPYCGELYTNTVAGWQEHKQTCSGRDEMPDSMKNRETKVADTDGNPLESGKLYLMHSVKYKVPDVVQLVRVEQNGIEAHIESDAAGAFPILISSDEFDTQGYSFEPYTAAAVEHCPLCQSDDVEVSPFNEHLGDVFHCRRCGTSWNERGQIISPESKLKLSAHKVHLTPKRQQELINENPGGKARNYDKLDLAGTHYEHKTFEFSFEDIDEHFLF